MNFKLAKSINYLEEIKASQLYKSMNRDIKLQS